MGFQAVVMISEAVSLLDGVSGDDDFHRLRPPLPLSHHHPHRHRHYRPNRCGVHHFLRVHSRPSRRRHSLPYRYCTKPNANASYVCVCCK